MKHLLAPLALSLLAPASLAQVPHVPRLDVDAAGLPGDWRAHSSLDWPLMEAPVDDPVNEARDGLAVFCRGQAMRNGLSISGAIVIPGADAEALFADDDTPFEVDCHRWPHPGTLLGDMAAKRACWPQLHATGEAWRQATAGTA